MYLPEHFQCDLLFGHGDACLLVHPDIVQSHPAKDGEGLDKVLVVLGEGQPVKLVDQLEQAQHLVRLVAVHYRHAKNALVLETLVLVNLSEQHKEPSVQRS